MRRVTLVILTIALAVLAVFVIRALGSVGPLSGLRGERPGGQGGENGTMVVDVRNGMVRIPGGTFRMGSDDGPDRERPVTRVTLSPYFIDQTEVTVAAYRQCVEAGKCEFQATEDWSGLARTDDLPDEEEEAPEERNALCNLDKPNRDNHPMNCVDWFQASNFCAWRSARLPTEAEWEFAAKGTDGRTYPWGNEKPNSQLARWNVGDGTVPVGSFPKGASPFGLLDMAGNVGEWVADWFGEYPGGSVSDPRGAEGDTYRIGRGGSWYNDEAQILRTSYRGWVEPSVRYNRIGFRCARGDEARFR